MDGKFVSVACPHCGGQGEVKIERNEHVTVAGKNVTVVSVGPGLITSACSFCGQKAVLVEGTSYQLGASSMKVKVKQKGVGNVANVVNIQGNVTRSNVVIGNDNTVNGETCPNCRQPVQPGWKLCPYCEAKLL